MLYSPFSVASQSLPVFLLLHFPCLAVLTPIADLMFFDSVHPPKHDVKVITAPLPIRLRLFPFFASRIQLFFTRFALCIPTRRRTCPFAAHDSIHPFLVQLYQTTSRSILPKSFLLRDGCLSSSPSSSSLPHIPIGLMMRNGMRASSPLTCFFSFRTRSVSPLTSFASSEFQIASAVFFSSCFALVASSTPVPSPGLPGQDVSNYVLSCLGSPSKRPRSPLLRLASFALGSVVDFFPPPSDFFIKIRRAHLTPPNTPTPPPRPPSTFRQGGLTLSPPFSPAFFWYALRRFVITQRGVCTTPDLAAHSTLFYFRPNWLLARRLLPRFSPPFPVLFYENSSSTHRFRSFIPSRGEHVF